MTTEEKLAHFLDASARSSQEKCDQLVNEYQASLAQHFEEHKEQTLAQAKLEMKAETDGIRREGNQKLAQENLHIRRKIIRKNNELKDKLFEEVTLLLEEYKQTPAYDELLQKQIQAAIDFAKQDEITIYIDPADAAKKDKLESAVKRPLTISEYSFMGGTRAVIPRRHILIDNSFESKLAEEREAFRFVRGKIHD